MPSTPTRPKPSITLRGISACRSISAGFKFASRNARNSAERLIDLRLLRRLNARIRHDPIGNKMPPEQTFDETECLRAGKKQLFRLLHFLLSLCFGFGQPSKVNTRREIRRSRTVAKPTRSVQHSRGSFGARRL